MDSLSGQAAVRPALLSSTVRPAVHAAILFLLLALSPNAFALGQASYIDTELNPHNFVIVHAKQATSIYVDANDYPGVIRSTGDLQSDIQKVTGSLPALI